MATKNITKKTKAAAITVEKNKFNQAAEELRTLLRARYPIIYIISNESEQNVLSIIDGICQQGTVVDKETGKGRYQKELFIWDCARGVLRYTKNPNEETQGANSSAKDPITALDHITGASATHDSINQVYVLSEFHHYLRDASVQRRLKLFHEIYGPETEKTLILLSPQSEGIGGSGRTVPQELENIISILDWPMPDIGQIEEYLTNNIIPDINENFKDKGLPPLKFSKDDMDNLVKSCRGLTLSQIENVSVRSAIEQKNIVPEVVITEKKQIIRKSGLMEYVEPEGNFDEIGGCDVLKNWLTLRRPILSEEAREFGCDSPSGCMLIGPWGTGKSTFAKAIINQWGIPGLRIDASKLMDSYVGSSERNTKAALDLAESIAPCILWWDEVDDFFSGSESSSFSDGGTTNRVIGIISTWMSEHEGTVFNIFTANDISKRPPKLFRKGRLDEIFIIDLPVVKEREDIYKIHINQRRPGQDYAAKQKINIKLLAKESTNFSGSEIKEAVNTGFITAYNDGKRDITTEDISSAIIETVPLCVTMSEQITEMRDWQKGRARRASSALSEPLRSIKEYDSIAPGSPRRTRRFD